MQNDTLVGENNAISIFKLQCNFYNGNMHKAYQSLSEENKIIIRNVYPALCKNKRQSKNEKLIYYKRCWEITESNAPFIEGIEKRKFKSFDIDHIVPIFYGYKNNIPPELIGSLENLRIIPNKDNFLKSYRITDDSMKILSIWKKKGMI